MLIKETGQSNQNNVNEEVYLYIRFTANITEELCMQNSLMHLTFTFHVKNKH